MSERQGQPLTISPPTSDTERSWLTALWQEAWGGTVMVTRGMSRHLSDAATLLARQGAQPVGAVTYVIHADAADCELLSLNATVQGQGVGSALLIAAEDHARRSGCQRVWLVTSNDNLDALRFYQRRGYRTVAVHAGAIDAARSVKPTIPLVGNDGIPLHDEIELAKPLPRPGDACAESLPTTTVAGTAAQ